MEKRKGGFREMDKYFPIKRGLASLDVPSKIFTRYTVNYHIFSHLHKVLPD